MRKPKYSSKEMVKQMERKRIAKLLEKLNEEEEIK